MKSISLYIDQNTYLTRMHPFTKLLYIVTAISVSLLAGGLSMYLFFVGISIVALISGKILKKVFPLIAFSFTILITIFFIQGLFYHSNHIVLMEIGPLLFYREGTMYATRIGLNILNMLLSFALFVLTTKPADLVEHMEKVGFPPKFGYVITSVFQIIPQMSGTMSTIMDAQRSRGMETEGNLITRAKAFIPLISPVVMSSLLNTRERAIALEVRGFDSKEKKTYLNNEKKKKSDVILQYVFSVIILAAAVRRILLWLL